MPDFGSDTPARSKTAIVRLVVRRDVGLREKVTHRMLYETCARADELLGVNIEDLNLSGRQCPVKAKGARAVRRQGQAREDYATETVYWDAGTARLLPLLIGERTRGPLLVTHRRPGPGKTLTPRDVCPDTGMARLSYGELRALPDRHTCIGGEEAPAGARTSSASPASPASANRGPPCCCSWRNQGTSPSAPPGVLQARCGHPRRRHQPPRPQRQQPLTAGTAKPRTARSGASPCLSA